MLDNGDGGPALGGELLIAMSAEVVTFGLTSTWHELAASVVALARETPGARLRYDRRHDARECSEQCGVVVPDSLLRELAGWSPGVASNPA